MQLTLSDLSVVAEVLVTSADFCRNLVCEKEQDHDEPQHKNLKSVMHSLCQLGQLSQRLKRRQQIVAAIKSVTKSKIPVNHPLHSNQIRRCTHRAKLVRCRSSSSDVSRFTLQPNLYERAKFLITANSNLISAALTVSDSSAVATAQATSADCCCNSVCKKEQIHCKSQRIQI